LESREVSDIAPEDGEQAGYVMRGDWDSDEVQFPVQWLDDSGMLRDNWEEARPKPVMYCPEHNRLTPGHRRQGQLDCGCFGSQGVEATWVKAPFLFCAECGVHHSRRGRSMELSKMFQFGSVGRSTAMDVLVGSTLQNLPEGQQKTIAFSDNRQDTALQAAHINNLFQRIKFRRALYQAVKQATNGVGLTDIGDQIFDVLEEVDMIPEALPSDRFGPEPDAKRRYINYLLFQTLLDLRKSQQRGQQSLEEVGLIEVNYKRLSRFAALDDPWEGVPILEDAEPDVRREYVQGFLDLFRRASAVSHHHFTDFGDFKRENISKLPDETLFHKQQFFRLPQGFSDETDTSGTEKVRRLTHPRSRHVKWTTRSLDVDEDRAAEVIDAVVDLLSDPDELPLLEQQKIQYVGQAYMLKPDYIRIHPHDPTDVSVCPKCKTVVTRDNLDLCISYSCGSVVPEPGDLTDSYFHDLYTRRFGEAVEILAAEHSGQVEGDDRRELETRFREEDELNTIVCTPTMELGIDIGDLSSVFMRNVPPNPSNYSQRAGRAGRQNQPSVVSTFCGSGFGRQSHDQYFYQRPQRIISGEISPPTFLLDNEDLIRSHINSLVLEVIEEKLFGSINQILEIKPEQNSYPVIESYLEDLEAAVAANESAIINAVKSAFSRELASEDSYDWLTDDVIGSHVDGFVQRFDEAFDPWRQEYARLYRQRRRLSKKADVEKLSYHERRERDAIEQRMEDMREGGQRFYTYQYLRSQGFLPNFGFPRSNCTLSFQTRKDDIQRDESRAIREFAPRNHVYYRGERYGVQYANPRTQDAEPITRSAIVCPACDTIIMGEEAEQAGACHVCGESFSGIHPNPNVMALPDQRAMSEQNITSDDEERKRKGYDIDSYYEQTDDATKYTLKSENVDDTAVTYEPSARIVTVNSGINSDDNEIDGFALCGECNRWLTSESQIEDHLGEDGCYANADPENIERGIELYVEGNHDTITLTTPLPEDLQSEQKDEFYTTLREALYQGILVEFDLDEQEIESFTKPPTDPDTDNQRIIIHETSEGGAGALNALMDETRLSRAFEEAIDVLHGNDSDGCERACYDCLMSYYNQREHGLLNRHVVLPWFESRMSLTLDVEESRESTDGARYEQLKSACDSSLEIAVLDAIRDGGFDLPDEAQKIIYDGDEPIAKPDFYYEPSGRPIAVFVDGPDHEKQHIKADDREKRNQLRQMNYRVVAVEDPDNVVDIWPLY
jgi:ribosomal protein L37AE/L43A